MGPVSKSLGKSLCDSPIHTCNELSDVIKGWCPTLASEGEAGRRSERRAHESQSWAWGQLRGGPVKIRALPRGLRTSPENLPSSSSRGLRRRREGPLKVPGHSTSRRPLSHSHRSWPPPHRRAPHLGPLGWGQGRAGPGGGSAARVAARPWQRLQLVFFGWF